MKLLTKEQEAEHYNATLRGGILGGVTGLAIGGVGVLGASRRYHFFRQLTLPLKAFLVTSAGTFGAIVSADHSSRSYERTQNPEDVRFDERQRERHAADIAGKTFTERAMDFGRRERYKIVGASWVASMFAAFALVNRNKYLSGAQKLVQARVYAQFLTLGVLVATAAFEISDRKNETGRYETIQVVDPTDPEHKRMIEKTRQVEDSDGDTLWKDMVAAEEERLREKEEHEKRLRSKGKKHHEDKGKDKSAQRQGADEKKGAKEADKKDQKKSNDGGDEKKKTDNEAKNKDEEKSKK